jgi:anti-anti-sigma factor
METIVSNKLRIAVTAISDTATLYLSGSFTFDTHREFKSAYKKYLTDSSIGHIVVNLAEVEYLDSSALGMLLVMLDHVGESKKLLALSRPSSIALRTFDIAGFHNKFVIN